MPAKSMDFASERRTPCRSHGEQHDHGAAGTDRRQKPGLSFTQDARMGLAYGKCRFRRSSRHGMEVASRSAPAFHAAQGCRFPVSA
jgi:hypothetical protein